jgi:hypothetical protein
MKMESIKRMRMGVLIVSSLMLLAAVIGSAIKASDYQLDLMIGSIALTALSPLTFLFEKDKSKE